MGKRPHCPDCGDAPRLAWLERCPSCGYQRDLTKLWAALAEVLRLDQRVQADTNPGYAGAIDDVRRILKRHDIQVNDVFCSRCGVPTASLWARRDCPNDGCPRGLPKMPAPGEE